MGSYMLCSRCKKPLINEYNLKVFRRRMLLYIGGGGILGTIAGAATLPLLGFGAGGVAAGSFAAAWQSSIGAVTAGSLFALLQSLGATGIGIILFGSVGAAAGGGALGLIYKYVRYFNWCECDQINKKD